MIIIFLITSFMTFLFPSKDENQSSFSYFGGWPINISKNMIQGPELNFNCPESIGCECSNDSECINGNCLRSPKGSYCYPKEGDIFPHFTSIDQFEDLVDIGLCECEKFYPSFQQILFENITPKEAIQFSNFEIIGRA